jgi:DeoR family transcriptional regulator, L-fucose operon activator
MLKYDRHRMILDEMQKLGSVKYSELVKIIPASKITIQRDLIELEEQKKLLRVHGGAVLSKDAFAPRLKITREYENVEIKKKLAKKAVEFIHPDDTVGIDASTTCEYIAEFMPDFPIMVVTASIDSFLSLTKKQNIIPILTGGKYSRDTQNLVGNFTVETIKKFSFSMLFLSASGLDPLRGTLEYGFDDYMVKSAFIGVSEKIILLLDSSKINRTQGIFTCPIGKINKIVTNKEADSGWPPDVIERVIVV